MEQTKIILVATDFSEHSKHAWEYALHEAQIHKAGLVVAHVIHRMVREDHMLMDTMSTMRVSEALRNIAEDQFQSMKKAAALVDVACKTFILEGTPFVEIIKCARETEADMAVVGSHGTAGLASMMLGSTAEKVVRKAPCSVVVVKQKGWVFKMP